MHCSIDRVQVLAHEAVLCALAGNIYPGQILRSPPEAVFQQAVCDFKKLPEMLEDSKKYTSGHHLPQAQAPVSLQSEQQPSLQCTTGTTQPGVDPQCTLLDLNRDLSSPQCPKNHWHHSTDVKGLYLSPRCPYWDLPRHFISDTTKLTPMALLHRLLTQLKPQQLVHLDDYMMPWLPTLRDLDHGSLPDAICGAFNEVKPPEKRLECTAWLFAWLIPLQDIRKWSVYRIREPPTPRSMDCLVAQLALSLKLFKHNDSQVAHAWVLRGSTVYGCLLIDVVREGYVELGVVYLALCTKRPLLVMHCSIDSVQVTVHEAVLGALVGNILYLGQTLRGPPEAVFQQAVTGFKNLLEEQEESRKCTYAHQMPREQAAMSSQSEQQPSLQGRTGTTQVEVNPQRAIFCDVDRSHHISSPQCAQEHWSHHSTDFEGQYLCPRCPYWDLPREQQKRLSQIFGADKASSSETVIPSPGDVSLSNQYACDACAPLFPVDPHMLCPDLLYPYCGLRFPEMTTFGEHFLMHTGE